ncbi:hypothetical protein HZH68_000038 [Vespula germanica]|uniref:Uncharacterized protein n=1 Tax=Vespula germanica TaxID=30212 RepID=A0A834NST2_VESGE|nr:hypothetical protein HZH68_000038 [Vespula germanica]
MSTMFGMYFEWIARVRWHRSVKDTSKPATGAYWKGSKRKAKARSKERNERKLKENVRERDGGWAEVLCAPSTWIGVERKERNGKEGRAEGRQIEESAERIGVREATEYRGWSVGRLVGRSVGRLAGWLVGWLDGWLADWLVGWLAGWLADWLAAWMPRWVVGLEADETGTGTRVGQEHDVDADADADADYDYDADGGPGPDTAEASRLPEVAKEMKCLPASQPSGVSATTEQEVKVRRLRDKVTIILMLLELSGVGGYRATSIFSRSQRYSILSDLSFVVRRICKNAMDNRARILLHIYKLQKLLTCSDSNSLTTITVVLSSISSGSLLVVNVVVLTHRASATRHLGLGGGERSSVVIVREKQKEKGGEEEETGFLQRPRHRSLP